MSDTAVMDDIEKTTKKGFDLAARLQNRGLRRATITLFTDDEKGVELGWAYDVRDRTNTVVIRRERGGIVGELDRLQTERPDKIAEAEAKVAALEAAEGADAPAMLKTAKADLTKLKKDLDAREKELTDQVEALTAKMRDTGIVVKMRAVPPVIQKNTRRLAKEKLGITEKGVPEDRQEEFSLCQLAFLMSVMFESVTDNESGAVNTETSYDDAVALMDYLPVGQFQRLNDVIGTVQFTDAISRSIEGQEDFS